MPNTESVIERIAIEIVERLERIRVENGYAFNVTEVIRNDRLGSVSAPRNHTIYVVQGDSLRSPEVDKPGNPPAIAYETSFDFKCFVKESDSLRTETASTVNEMAAAVRKAIVTPETSPSTWYTMGGEAILCNWGDNSPFPAQDGSNAGVVVSLLVLHRESETDPYESRS